MTLEVLADLAIKIPTLSAIAIVVILIYVYIDNRRTPTHGEEDDDGNV